MGKQNRKFRISKLEDEDVAISDRARVKIIHKSRKLKLKTERQKARLFKIELRKGE